MRHAISTGSTVTLGAPVKNNLNWLAILVLAGVMVYDHLPASVKPDLAINVGRAYGKSLAATYADAWDAAADAIDAGKPVSEVQVDLQSNWKAAREAAFLKAVAPTFAAVLAPGEEPTDRAKVSAMWRQFAKGLRHVR